MKKNMGITDRVLRSIVAIAVAVLYFTGTISGVIGIVLLAFAGILVLTSLVSFCPLYLPFGLSTLRKRNVAK